MSLLPKIVVATVEHGVLSHPEFWPYKIFFVKTQNLDLDLDLLIFAPQFYSTFLKTPKILKTLIFSLNTKRPKP